MLHSQSRTTPSFPPYSNRNEEAQLEQYFPQELLFYEKDAGATVLTTSCYETIITYPPYLHNPLFQLSTLRFMPYT